LYAWYRLAAQDRRAREKPLAARSRVLIVVNEFERPLTKLEYRHVGWCAHVERAAVAEHLEHPRRIDSRPRNHLIERHPESEKLGRDVWEVEDVRRAPLGGPVGRERVGPEARLHDALDDVPPEMTRPPVADIEPNAAAPRGKHFRQDVAGLVHDAVRR